MLPNALQILVLKSLKRISEKGLWLRAIKAPNSSSKPRAWFDKLNGWARDEGQKG